MAPNLIDELRKRPIKLNTFKVKDSMTPIKVFENDSNQLQRKKFIKPRFKPGRNVRMRSMLLLWRISSCVWVRTSSTPVTIRHTWVHMATLPIAMCHMWVCMSASLVTMCHARVHTSAMPVTMRDGKINHKCRYMR